MFLFTVGAAVVARAARLVLEHLLGEPGEDLLELLGLPFLDRQRRNDGHHRAFLPFFSCDSRTSYPIGPVAGKRPGAGRALAGLGGAAPLAAGGRVYDNAPMPTGVERVLAFAHPVCAVLALAFLAYVASLGLRARERGGAVLRPRHAHLAPWAFAGIAGNFAFGLLSTWLWRRDLELAAGAHFWFGVAICAVLSVVALLSRRIATSAGARTAHPALGMLALLLAALQVFVGLSLVAL